MSRFAERLREISRAEAESLESNLRGDAKTRTRQIALDAARRTEEIPTDDGIPPEIPYDVSAEAQRRAVVVEWGRTPEEDWVEYTEVKWSRGASPGTDPKQDVAVTTNPRRVRIDELPGGVEHVFEVRHVDRWGRESEYADAVWATPDFSVAEVVDLEAARISGELGYDNIEQLRRSDKIAEGIIEARNMAAQNAALFNLWVENAAIQSAKIATIGADKITAGIISADVEISSSGIIRTGAARMTPDGIELTEVGSAVDFPHFNRQSWMKPRNLPADPLTAFAGIGFFNSSSGVDGRGVAISASGLPNNSRIGRIRLAADNGNQVNTANATAVYDMRSGGSQGTHEFKGQMFVDGDLFVSGDIGSTTFFPRIVIGPRPGGQWVFAAHNVSTDATFSSPIHDWRILANSSASYNGARQYSQIGGISVTRISGGLRISNTSGSGWYFNIAAWTFGTNYWV